MDKYRAVLFDFDGVIAHTQPIMKQVLWRFFSEKKISIDEGEYARDDWWTKSLNQVCETLKIHHNIELNVNELRASIWESQKSLFEAGLESDPTLIPFLKYCQHHGIKMAIGSNSARERIEWVLRLMGIENYFNRGNWNMHLWQGGIKRGWAIIWANDLTQHKPDPEVWLKCAELLEVPITECLMIEDGLPGLTGAKECWAQRVYYHWFCQPEKNCVEIAERSVGSFGELIGKN